MNLKHISIFNLIEIFRNSRRKRVKVLNPETHCEQKQMHDFYCDTDNHDVESCSVD